MERGSWIRPSVQIFKACNGDPDCDPPVPPAWSLWHFLRDWLAVAPGLGVVGNRVAFSCTELFCVCAILWKPLWDGAEGGLSVIVPIALPGLLSF